MKILDPQQIKFCDEATINQLPITSIDLMEKAALQCVKYITQQYRNTDKVVIVCGKGNNGGDGLAVARLLLDLGYITQVYILEYSQQSTNNFDQNLHRYQGDITFVSHWDNIEFNTTNNSLLIDAIFGNGLNKPLSGLVAEMVQKMNSCRGVKIAIDIPTGLYANIPIPNNSVVFNASLTLTFQCPKLSFMMKESFMNVGNFIVLDIGWHLDVDREQNTSYSYTTKHEAISIFKPRNKFNTKHDFGHALLIAGSYGKIGAALLATKACLRAGAGLTTSYIPKCGYSILQAQAPEAMCISDLDEEIITQTIETKPFSAIAIGPGIGFDNKTQEVVETLLNTNELPLVIDADAINILALKKNLLKQLKPNTILTPHTREFERLTQKCTNDFERLNLAIEFTTKYKIILVLKGTHTAIINSDGKVYFNSTGNPALAKGGSGDVLTGIIVALLAQKYSPLNAAILGVYLHGLSADFASLTNAVEWITAEDIISNLSKSFLNISA